MLRRKPLPDPTIAPVTLNGRRVVLRPLSAHDFDSWREVRRRCDEWLTRWEPRRIPGQPETRRFAAGVSDTSPDLAGALRFTALVDADGDLRLLDFAAPAPDAVQLEGLRGSLALHETWQNDRALGSLFHAATGNLVDVAPVQCRRLEQMRAAAKP